LPEQKQNKSGRRVRLSTGSSSSISGELETFIENQDDLQGPKETNNSQENKESQEDGSSSLMEGVN
jgi:hypothetical protein